MNGSELRDWRTSRGLYQRDVVKILTDGGLTADQPMVSEYERGILEVPAEVDAALAAAAHAHPVTGEPTPAPAPRKSRARPRAEQVREQVDAGDDGDDELEPDDGNESDPNADPDRDAEDRPPRPVRPAGKVAGDVQAVTWDTGVRSQLEKDLRVLFAGDVFLVPVPVQQADGSVEYAHEEGFQPGIAQLVGYMDPYDGAVIQMNAAAMAHAWASLADESPQVRRLLLMLTYGGAWRGVIAATLPVLYAIGVHHGLIPPVLGGAGAAPQVAPPDGVPVG